MEESEDNIRALFNKATTLRQKLEGFESTSEVYQENLRSAISTLEHCRRAADQISLFSPNETEEDVPSGDLQYLNIDYFLGELTTRQIGSDRKILLQATQHAYEKYLSLLETYTLLSASDERLYEQYLDDREHFSLLSTTDPSKRRETKISRFKQETELKRKLEHLALNPLALENDDSALRSLRRAEINLNVHTTFHSLDLIAQEIAILSLAPSSPPPKDPSSIANDYRERTQGRGRQGTDPSFNERLDPPISQLLSSGRGAGPILSKEGKPLKPFTLLDNRQNVRNGVFRPDHSLPTMSIDEYLAEERRRGGMIDGGGGETGGAGTGEGEVNEDDLEKADEETRKAREWDEFKEENPKGSGNTLNRG